MSQERYLAALRGELREQATPELRARVEAEGIAVAAPETHDSLSAQLLEHVANLPRERVGNEWQGPNFVGSAAFTNTVWMELFLHFRERPAALQSLLRGALVPRCALSATTISDVYRGLRAVLSQEPELTARVRPESPAPCNSIVR